MKKTRRVSDAVIRRLPRYYRVLGELARGGVERISSGELGNKMDYTASQIRQDLNHFGDFGQQGYGYNVEALSIEVSKILGITKNYKMVLAGCGRLGRAIANYIHTYNDCCRICGIFDVDPRIIGEELNGVPIQNISNLLAFMEEVRPDIGIISVPKNEAQKVADAYREGGIKAIWNFAPTDIDYFGDIPVENVHLTDGLYALIYRMNNPQEKRQERL